MQNCDTLSGIRVQNVRSVAKELDVVLGVGELINLQEAARGARIICQQGYLWITQEGDPQDHILRVGERFVVGRPGRIVIQGLREGRGRLVPASA